MLLDCLYSVGEYGATLLARYPVQSMWVLLAVNVAIFAFAIYRSCQLRRSR